MATEWYVAIDGDKCGPITSVQLATMGKEGRITTTALVWKEGMGDWAPASKVKGLRVVPADPPKAIAVVREPAPEPAPVVNVEPQRRPMMMQQQSVVVIGGDNGGSGGVIPALASFFIPGLGQLIKGQPLNAIVWFFVVLMGYAALVVPGIVLHLCCIVGAASSKGGRSRGVTVITNGMGMAA